MKALIITPTPTHPTNAGNRKVVLQTCNRLRDMGFEIDCVYLPFENYDHNKMNLFFNGQLFIPDKNKIYSNSPRLAYIRKRLYEKITRTLLLKKREREVDSLKYNVLIDESLPIYLLNWFKKNINVNSYDLVVCEYVWVSKFLEYFPDHIFKIINAHDVFSNRYKIYQSINQSPEWVSLFPSQEAKGLRRADLIIALNEKEKKYFHALSGVNCVRCGFIPEANFIQKDEFGYKIVYFASNNQLNLQSIEWFISNVLNLISEKEPRTKLLIGGKICSSFSSVNEKVELLGEFENPLDFYNLGDVIINPEQSGTGLKIKAVEAFSYGLPLVATKEGVRGADTPYHEHYIEANSPIEFANAILDLFSNEKKRVQIVENARLWLMKNRAQSVNDLLAHLDKFEICPLK